MKPLLKFFGSLRLTVVCLALGVVLVFFGTLAQVNDGIYAVQARWFQSLFVWWGPRGASWSIPIYPGGYLLGGVLLINLTAAHIQRFQFTWRKLGISVAHAGIVLLLVGQLATDQLSHQSVMSFAKGETRRYSESQQRAEMVFLTDAAAAGQDQVVAIPESRLKSGDPIQSGNLPFTVQVKAFYPNAELRQRGPMVDTGPPPATQGFGKELVVTPAPEVKSTDQRNEPCAILELKGPGGSMGTWLVSTMLGGPQEIMAGGKVWRLAMRMQRDYLPYSVQLLSTKYEVYPGTDTPKNFQSRVRIENPAKRQNREVDIYMNSPLRYEGNTYYQYQMDRVTVEETRGSVLQVVKNPSWLTPYLGCICVAFGLAYQFLWHLVGFISRRRLV